MRSRSLLSLVAVALATGTMSPVGSSAASSQPRLPTESRAAGTHAAGVESHTVTLVTGDVVRLVTDADGHQTATVVRRVDPTGNYHTYTSDGDVHVEPGSAFALLAEGRLDPALFNVSGLVRQGYHDGARSTLPLIVEYEEAASLSGGLRAAAVSQRAQVSRVLDSVHGLAVRARKADAAAWWRDVTAVQRQRAPELRTRLSRPIDRIWLDARTEATLADSTSQIGAPAAWADGLEGQGVTVAVLDTGIDQTHPDLAGKVTSARDFTGSGTTVDGSGHGTHVASIAAGTGAAADGRERGVAPAADLMIGKVLDDSGSGAMSWAIDGMEWAAGHGADVVNLSLGGPVTTGDDPMSQAVDDLTAAHDTLFVVAAGNTSFSQPGTRDVTAPGAAARALTVGASTDRDFLWSGSRQGLMGDQSIKPDLVAPGRNILAARAAGTGWGDGPYISMTGTSMATPHVAGAAALLRQRHPAWTAEQVKAALMATTRPLDGYAVTEAGTGRLDVARATRQQVYVDRAMLHMGYFARPYDTDRMRTTETLTYTNGSQAPVTLDLTTTLTDSWGDPMPDGILDVTPSAVTIAPGESATATVTVDVSGAEPAEYTGRITATGDDGLRLGTGVGFYKQDDTVDVTFRALDTRGEPAVARVRIDRYKDSDGRYYADNIYFTPDQREWTLRLPEGDYNLFGLVVTPDASGRFVEEQSIVHDPLVSVRAPNSTITLDARTAEPVSLRTPRPSTPRELTMIVHRGDPGSPYATSDEWYWNFVDGEPERISVAATERVDDAPFALVSQWASGVDLLTTRVVGRDGRPLDAVYQGGPLVDGLRTLDVVDAGTAAPSDLTAGIRGKAALVRESPRVSWEQQVRDAAAAGAAVVILYSARPGAFYPQVGGPVPVLALNRAEGDRLRASTARAAPTQIQLHGTPRSPYSYDLTFVEDGQVTAPLAYQVDRDQLAEVKARFHTTGTDEEGWRVQAGSFAGCACGPSPTADYVPSLGYTRTEYVTADPLVSTYGVWWFRANGWPGDMLFARSGRTYRAGDKTAEDWLKAPLSPGIANTVTTPYGWKMQVRRYGFSDYIRYELAGLTDSAGHWARNMPGGDATVRFYQDGDLLQERSGLTGGVSVPAEEATYRLEANVDHDGSVLGLSTRTRTAWTFRSGATGEEQLLPLIDVDYTEVADAATGDAALDLTNTAPTGADVELRLRTAHQNGSTAPPVDRMRVWVSYDDGGTWKPAEVERTGDDAFSARYTHPRNGQHVSLRVAASDGDGNTFEQTLIHAYRLSS